MLTYLFYPNPGNTYYSSPKVIILFVLCALMLVASFLIARWRKKGIGAITKKLSRTWVSVLRIFSIIGFFLVVARVEEIQFVSMRFLWLLWLLCLFAFAVFQAYFFRKMHYTIQPKVKVHDARDAYIPKPGSARRR